MTVGHLNIVWKFTMPGKLVSRRYLRPGEGVEESLHITLHLVIILEGIILVLP
jgi:hypothetical protein